MNETSCIRTPFSASDHDTQPNASNSRSIKGFQICSYLNAKSLRRFSLWCRSGDLPDSPGAAHSRFACPFSARHRLASSNPVSGFKSRPRGWFPLSRFLRSLSLTLSAAKMVPKRGLEPLHPCGHQNLNLARLPIPPPRLVRSNGFDVLPPAAPSRQELIAE